MVIHSRITKFDDNGRVALFFQLLGPTFDDSYKYGKLEFSNQIIIVIKFDYKNALSKKSFDIVYSLRPCVAD